jgi:phage shock protein A
MGLLKRLKTIVKGQTNKAIEKAERADPIAIAKAEYQEAKEDLAKLESGVKRAKGSINIAIEQIHSAEHSAKDWKNKAKIAKDNGNIGIAQKAAEKSIEFSEEATRRKASLKTSQEKFDVMYERFKNKTKELDALGSKIKEADINFKTAKALNNLETSETSGGGIKSVDRINDMLNIANEEVAMSEASIEIESSDDAKLLADIEKMGSNKKASDLLESL